MSGPCHILVITKKGAPADIPNWKELRKLSEDDDPEAEESGR